MIPALARALWPFFVRFSAPSLPWIARAGGGPQPAKRVRIAHIQYPQTIYTKQFGGAADFVPALGSPEETSCTTRNLRRPRFESRASRHSDFDRDRKNGRVACVQWF